MNEFNWKIYVNNYEDLRKVGINTKQKAWAHWEMHGKSEGRSYTNIQNHPRNHIKPVIFCIGKLEHDYIEEFVRYHIALGFDWIYIYDNEDQPTYEKLLEKYSNNSCYGNSKEEMNKYFYIPLFLNTFKHLKSGGHYCLNINKEI